MSKSSIWSYWIQAHLGRDRFASSGRGISSAGSRIVSLERSAQPKLVEVKMDDNVYLPAVPVMLLSLLDNDDNAFLFNKRMDMIGLSTALFVT